jgi:hypothetical protein
MSESEKMYYVNTMSDFKEFRQASRMISAHVLSDKYGQDCNRAMHLNKDNFAMFQMIRDRPESTFMGSVISYDPGTLDPNKMYKIDWGLPLATILASMLKGINESYRSRVVIYYVNPQGQVFKDDQLIDTATCIEYQVPPSPRRKIRSDCGTGTPARVRMRKMRQRQEQIVNKIISVTGNLD